MRSYWSQPGQVERSLGDCQRSDGAFTDGTEPQTIGAQNLTKHTEMR